MKNKRQKLKEMVEASRQGRKRADRLMKILIFFMVFGCPIGYGLGLLILRVFFRRG